MNRWRFLRQAGILAGPGDVWAVAASSRKRAWRTADAAVETTAAAHAEGRPLGGDAFLSRVETFLDRRIRAMPPGRPKGGKGKAK